jgi:hypothetical protein
MPYLGLFWKTLLYIDVLDFQLEFSQFRTFRVNQILLISLSTRNVKYHQYQLDFYSSCKLDLRFQMLSQSLDLKLELILETYIFY